MELKIKIDVPYIVDEKTYYVEKEIVFEQSYVKENDENFFEISLNVDSNTDVLLH